MTNKQILEKHLELKCQDPKSEYMDDYEIHELNAMDEFAEQQAIEFLDWATARNVEISLGVFVDNEGTYDSIEEYYQLFLNSNQ